MTVEQNLCSLFLLCLFPLNIHPIHKRKKQFCHHYKLYIQESNGSVNIDIIVESNGSVNIDIFVESNGSVNIDIFVDSHFSLYGRSFFFCICLEQTFWVVCFFFRLNGHFIFRQLYFISFYLH